MGRLQSYATHEKAAESIQRQIRLQVVNLENALLIALLLWQFLHLRKYGLGNI